MTSAPVPTRTARPGILARYTLAPWSEVRPVALALAGYLALALAGLAVGALWLARDAADYCHRDSVAYADACAYSAAHPVATALVYH